jgi:nicotinate dehydrogenase subunit A
LRSALIEAHDVPVSNGNPKGDSVAKRIELNVNGKTQTIEAEPDMPLLYALRNDLGMNDPHFGCGLAQCGACTVLLNGAAVRSCALPVGAVGNGKVTTLAGIGTPEKPHKVQAAFIEEQVPQCGYCLNGWIMTTVALLENNPRPTDSQIRDALTGLKCRCGTHVSILRAVKRAAQA